MRLRILLSLFCLNFIGGIYKSLSIYMIISFMCYFIIGKKVKEKKNIKQARPVSAQKARLFLAVHPRSDGCNRACIVYKWLQP
jgi:uncharacterized membrane protein